jgi:hypothetical protein
MPGEMDMTTGIKLVAIGIVAPSCVVLGKLLLVAVIAVAVLAYLTICIGCALQAVNTERQPSPQAQPNGTTQLRGFATTDEVTA